MRRQEDLQNWSWVFSGRACLLIWLPVTLITLSHYTALPSHHWLHDIFRRLYYIPIIFGAFLFGVRGSLMTSMVASIFYLPHAFSNLVNPDPAHSVEKILEILLYNVIAFITGILADREFEERLRQQSIAIKLQETLEEMKLIEEQLIRAGRLQALGELTAGLAHEIKNPLASLKGAAEIISDEIPSSSPRHKMVSILQSELNRLENLLDRFLSFARPQPYEMTLFPLDSVIRDVVSLSDLEGKKSGVTLTVEPGLDSLMVHADKEKLSQVILNLILNAIQAMPGGGSVRITTAVVTRRSAHPFVNICVADEGPGIAEEVKEKIFNPFYTTKPGGSGLGLSIAARIVYEHGGLIEVENGSGGGAVFTVLIPHSHRNSPEVGSDRSPQKDRKG